MNTYITRTIKQLKVGTDGTAYLRFSGSSKSIKANVLDVQKDDAGRIESMILDRMVHSPSRDYQLSTKDGDKGRVVFSGEYVSEMQIARL